MKTILSTLIFSFLGLNIIFAKEELNFDDPKVQDQIIATAAKKLDEREKADGEKIYYLPFSPVPYSGWYIELSDNGQLKFLMNYKDGLSTGLYINWYDNGQMNEYSIKNQSNSWYENGQKKGEVTYKYDRIWSAKAWLMDGEKCPVTNIKEGNGTIRFYLFNGEAFADSTYINQKRVNHVEY